MFIDKSSIAGAIKAGGTNSSASINLSFNYGTDMRPTGVTYNATVNPGAQKFSKTFGN